MAIYRLDSPEFAESFRNVSDSILAALQSLGCSHGSRNQVESESQKGGNYLVDPNEEGLEETVSEVPLGNAEILYSSRPIPRGDGTYVFKNLSSECQDGHTYKIWRYEDGSCEFELRVNLDNEERQIFKDNQAERMPDAVGIADGNISADGAIIITRRGKGTKMGKSVLVTEPVLVKFN